MQTLAIIRIPPTEEKTAICNGFSKNPTFCIFSLFSVIAVDRSVVKNDGGNRVLTIGIDSDFVDKEIVIVEAMSVKVIAGLVNAVVVLVSES